MKDQDSTWVQEEFNTVRFWDKRLDKRLMTITQALSEQPGVCINQAFNGNWSDTKAAYEFFNNDKVTKEEILNVHRKKTVDRAQDSEVLLAINDTTSFNFTNHKNLQGKGLIAARNTYSSGFLYHHVLLINSDKVPLGEIYQDFWTRDKIKENPSLTNQKLSLKDKESYKWIKALKASHQFGKECKKRLIVIGDRESDLCEFFFEAKALNQEFVIRAQHNRLVNEQMPNLWEYMQSQTIVGKSSLAIESKGGRPAKEIELTIKYATVSFKTPKHLKAAKTFTLTAILVEAKDQNIEWMLLTNIAVQNIQDVKMVIKWYSCRWTIEEYHKIIKSGCKIEECRLESMERLLIFFTIISIIAWRIFYMTRINNLYEELPCTKILSEEEWKALYCMKHQTLNLPKEIPTVREAIRWIASLGGFLGRKGDKEPGVVTIWRGFRRLNDIVLSWNLFNHLITSK